MRLLVSILLFILIGHATAQEIQGTVVSVIDGNTLKFVDAANDTSRFVFEGIDCPELEQEFGQEAKLYTEKLLLGKAVTILVQSKDRLGNKVGVLKFKGRDPRLELLARGLAWTAEKYPDPSFEQLKEIAKGSGKGLWKLERPVAPWTFRREQSMAVAKSS